MNKRQGYICKGMFAGYSTLFQLLVLFFLILTGALLSGMVALLLPGNSLSTDPLALLTYQFFASAFTFLVPSLLMGYLCSTDCKDYLSLGPVPPFRLLLLTFLSMLLLQPTIGLLGMLNQEIHLPESMAPVESWMQAMEETAAGMTAFLLSRTDPLSLLLNLLVIAVTAAVAEEFFFRGVMQRVIGRWLSNHHAVIWIAAFLFSAIHLQFYGLIPRMLLGAYLGYLLYWSRNIWLPVFAHFLNNALAVLVMSDRDLKDNSYLTGEPGDVELVPFAIVAAFTFLLFLYCMRSLRREGERG